MGEQPFAAEWAWIGKKPGAREDYSVLDASDRHIRVGEFIGGNFVGAPSSSNRDNAPTGPPWVTFRSHPTNVRRPLLSVLLLDDWQDLDQAGRPIWPQRFFLCRYDEAAGVHASYRALWEAVSPFPLPRPDRQLVPIEIQPQSAASAVEAIGEIGFERAAAMAAALLAGPVAVTGTADLYLSDPDARLDRLAVLDAVAALLPYGFRADLSASSAVDNAVAHRVQLVLTNYPSDSQQVAPLRGAPVTPRSDVARDYLDMLRAKRHLETLETIVAHLREARDPCSFAHPRRALEILNELNRDRHKVMAAVTAPESLKSSFVFFDDTPAEVARMWQYPEMTAPVHRKLVRPLLDSGDEAAADALRQNWDVVTDTLVTIVNRDLNQGDTGRAGRSLRVVGSLPLPESADRLLLKLAVPPQEDLGQDWLLGIRTRAVLLQQLRMPPPPGDLGMTCIALRGGQAESWQGYLVKELLSRELADNPTVDRAAAWTAWLSRSEVEGNPAEWVLALGYVLGHQGGTRDQLVRALIQGDPVWAVTVLRLAWHAGRIREVLEIPGLADDLIELAARIGTQTGQEDTRLALASAVAVSLWDCELAPATIAKVDVFRQLLGYPLEDFPHERSRPECDRYIEALTHVLELPAVQKRGNSFVIGFLNGGDAVNTPARLSDGTVCLFEAWSKNDRLAAVLASYVATSGVIRLLWRDRRFGYEFWSRLVEHEPGLGHTLAMPLLVEMVEEAIKNRGAALSRFTDEQRGVTGSKLALALYRAWRGGMSSAQIIDIIDTVPVGNTKLINKLTHFELDNVLREFESMLTYPAANAGSRADSAITRQARAEDILFEFWQLICAGHLGEAYGRDFRRYLDDRLKAEQASRKRARRMLRRTLRQRVMAFVSRRRRRRQQRAAAEAAAQGQALGAWPALPGAAVAGGSADVTVPARAAPLPRAALVPGWTPSAASPPAEPIQPPVRRRWLRRLFQRLFGGQGKRAARKRATEGQDAQGASR